VVRLLARSDIAGRQGEIGKGAQRRGRHRNRGQVKAGRGRGPGGRRIGGRRRGRGVSPVRVRPVLAAARRQQNQRRRRGHESKVRSHGSPPVKFSQPSSGQHINVR